MRIKFTDEQIALMELARDFSEKEVRPVMAELDARHDPRECYPRELVRKGSELGLRTLSLPEEYGGMDADPITLASILSTMSEIEVGMPKIFSQCWKNSGTIAAFGNDEQKKKFLTQFANDPDCVISICMTEPNSGSDNVSPYNAPPGQGIMTAAVPDGNDYIINGSKTLISLAGFSKLLLVVTRTDPSRPTREGITYFVVPTDLPGVSFGRVFNKMGWRLYPTGEVFFDNVRVPKEYMLGKLNGGSEIRARSGRGDIEIPAQILGVCKAIYRIATDHAKQRIQGGKPIIQHQSVGAMLAEMTVLIDTLETYLYEIAYNAQLEKYDPKKTRIGRIYSRQCMIKAVILGLDILSSAAIMRDHPIEKLIRDGLTLLHGSGTISLLHVRLGEYLATL